MSNLGILAAYVFGFILTFTSGISNANLENKNSCTPSLKKVGRAKQHNDSELLDLLSSTHAKYLEMRSSEYSKKYIWVGLKRYEILQFLGKGGNGEVYLVNTVDGPRVLKKYRKDYYASYYMNRDIRSLKNLKKNGYNIPEIHSVKYPNIFMEYVEGIPLMYLDEENPHHGLKLGLSLEQIQKISAHFNLRPYFKNSYGIRSFNMVLRISDGKVVVIDGE